MILILISSNLLGNDKIKKVIENYESSKKNLDAEYLNDLKREKEKVIDAYNYEIKNLTKKGDLEAANGLLASKKSWEETNPLEVSNKLEDEGAKNIKPMGDYKYSLAYKQSWSYTSQPENTLTVKHVLCSDKVAKVGSKIKIIGTYEIKSHDEGTLSIIQNGSLAGDKISAAFKRGESDFYVEGVYLKEEDLKMSIYPKGESGIGQIVITF